jgi:hypothetical protein
MALCQVALVVTSKFNELFQKTTFSKRKVLAGIVMVDGRDTTPHVISLSTGTIQS